MEKKSDHIIDRYPSADHVRQSAARVRDLYSSSPVPESEMIDQLVLYTSNTALRRFMHFDRLYQKILDVQGVIMQFGVRWGRDIVSLQALRSIYEPMNYTRRIIGFDTFAGFPEVSAVDGNSEIMQPGGYAVTNNYEDHLTKLLDEREAIGPYSHLRRTELHKGDAPEQLAAYLDKHPETIISFAYFDMDIYEPTRSCAEIIRPYLCRGAVIAFDELMHPSAPGETKAVREVFGNNIAFRRIPLVGPGHPGYFIFE